MSGRTTRNKEVGPLEVEALRARAQELLDRDVKLTQRELEVAAREYSVKEREEFVTRQELEVRNREIAAREKEEALEALQDGEDLLSFLQRAINETGGQSVIPPRKKRRDLPAPPSSDERTLNL